MPPKLALLSLRVGDLRVRVSLIRLRALARDAAPTGVSARSMGSAQGKVRHGLSPHGASSSSQPHQRLPRSIRRCARIGPLQDCEALRTVHAGGGLPMRVLNPDSRTEVSSARHCESPGLRFSESVRRHPYCAGRPPTQRVYALLR